MNAGGKTGEPLARLTKQGEKRQKLPVSAMKQILELLKEQ